MATAAAFLLLSAAAGAAEAATADQQGYPLTLTRGSRLMIAASVNGRPVNAVLDSAAEMTLIDPQLARQLNLKSSSSVAAQGSGQSSFAAGLVNGVQLKAVGLTLADQTVAIVDLSDVGQRLFGHRLDAILGREIFDAARLVIDIDAHRIRVLKSGRDPSGVRLELVTEHGVETVPVRVEGGEEVRATFDLGNGSGVLIGSNFVERMHLLTDGRSVSTESGGGLGGATARQVIKLRTLEVAGQTFTDVSAAIDAHPSASDVNIGVAVLRRFVITTDFANHSVWLKPRGP